MRSSTVKEWWMVILAGMVLLVFGQIAMAQDNGANLIGTWSVQVIQVDCQSGTALGPPFSSLLTFADGGTMAEDTRNPVFGPGQRGGGQGLWRFPGHFHYRAKSVAYIKYTTQPDPETHNPGFEAGQQTITQDITFNPQTKQWSSTAAVVFTDTTGSVYRQGCAIANAREF